MKNTLPRRPLLTALLASLLLTACNDHRELMRRAATGETAACFEYGRCMLTGKRGIRKDPEQAQQWLLAAAQQGSSPAMAALGACHAAGIGYPRRDLKAARYWYRRAAQKGNAFALLALESLDHPDSPEAQALRKLRRRDDACRTLANIHLKADKPELLTAIDCIRTAAIDGNGEAAYLMSLFYARGKGVPQHAGIARGWRKNAIEAGFTPPQE